MMGVQRAHELSEAEEPSGFLQGAETMIGAEPKAMEPAGRMWLAALLGLAALAWIVTAAWSAASTLRGADLDQILQVIALSCVPLALFASMWIIFGRSSRRETERFARAAASVRGESAALDSVLQIVAARLEEAHARLGSETARLMTLSDEAADRLGRVTQYLANESAQLDRKAGLLESAANAARVDIGVLLNDLPRAEEQARSVTEALRDAGFTAHAETGQLESQLSALIARGREADEIVGGAAQRLGAHLARIQSSTITAAQQLDKAAIGMTGVLDETLARASEAVEASRRSLDGQGQAMLAMIEQARALLEQAGEGAYRNLSARLEGAGGQVDDLARRIAEQDEAARTLSEAIARDLAELEGRFAALAAAGDAGHAELGRSMEAVRGVIAALTDDLGSGQARAVELTAHARDLSEAMDGVTGQLHGKVAPALAAVEAQADRTRRSAESLAPFVEGLQVGALDAANQVAAAEAAITRQREVLPGLLDQIRTHVGELETRLASLGETARDVDSEAGRIVEETGPGLIDALVRVREAAAQAAERARDTINAVIPESAGRLAEASRVAVSGAIGETVAVQVDELTALAERASETARAASERLTRQMMGIGEAAAAVDARIDAARAAHQARDSESFARRVAALIDALHGAAVDVSRILSAEVGDIDWAAYLKGERGAFSRRAVRLIDSREAREIARLYQQDGGFAELVSRYIVDFEAMLRRIGGERDGEKLAVTMLSSDMGRLYVALAQAIERIRG